MFRNTIGNPGTTQTCHVLHLLYISVIVSVKCEGIASYSSGVNCIRVD